MTTDNFRARSQPIFMLKSHPSFCPANLFHRDSRRSQPVGKCSEPLGEWRKSGNEIGKYYKLCDFHGLIYYDLSH